MITIIYEILNEILTLFRWAVILAAVFAMLVSFGVLDTRNRIVWTIGDFLARVTEPVLQPIRRRLPNFGNIDISPLLVLAVIQLVILPLLQRLQIAVTTGVWQALLT